jgi:hypothetical protein
MKFNNILTPKTLAEKLGITEQTLLSWRSDGLPIIRRGKFLFIFEDSFFKWFKSLEEAQDAPGREKGKSM